MSWLSYIVPQKVAEFSSKHNGKVSVIESMGRNYIDVGGLMQSGNFLIKTWSRGLEKLKVTSLRTERVLLLGLGGGSFVHVVNNYYPHARITAVDIDPVIVEVGQKYLKLKTIKNLKTIITDAKVFVTQSVKKKDTYDLIFVDLYNGYTIPSFVESESFIKQLGQLKTKNGVLIFNRLFFQNHKNEAGKFLDKVRQMHQDVEVTQVYANLLVKVS